MQVVRLRMRSSVQVLLLFPACLGGRKRQECDVARALDSERETALVLGARADLATRFDLAAFSQVAAQLVALLIVDIFHFG